MLQSAKNLLISSDASVVADTVERLFEKIASVQHEAPEEALRRDFLISLLCMCKELRSVNLALVVSEKLDEKLLAKLARDASKKSTEEQQTILEIAARHLRPASSEPPKRSASDLFAELSGLEKIDASLLASKDCKRILLNHFEAHLSEVEENFGQALRSCSEAGCQNEHLARLTMKEFVCSSQQALQQHCAGSGQLQSFWIKYLLVLGELAELRDFFKQAKLFLPAARYAESNECLLNDAILSSTPNVLADFIASQAQGGRLDPKLLAQLADMGANLSPEVRKQLIEILLRGIGEGRAPEACRISLCVGHLSQFLSLTNSGPNETIQYACSFGAPSDIMYLIGDSLRQKFAKGQRASTGRGGQGVALYSACLKLGLLDRALWYLFAQTTDQQWAELTQPVRDHLAIALDNAHLGALEFVDPILEESTLHLIGDSLVGCDDKESSKNVITIVILSCTAFISKTSNELGASDSLAGRSSSKLEAMFKHLQHFIHKLAFNLCDKLIGATNGLTLSIKKNLDALGDSQTIRESFRSLIESVAGKCMIESRYKKAAMLYSHIDDNVNAIKSLMRLGDVDTVINYALLVKDFTVNRITINYLKHLSVEPTIIEDFVSRSQG